MIQIFQKLASDRYTQLDKTIKHVIKQREEIEMQIEKLEGYIDDLDNMHDSILEKMAEELERDNI